MRQSGLSLEDLFREATGDRHDVLMRHGKALDPATASYVKLCLPMVVEEFRAEVREEVRARDGDSLYSSSWVVSCDRSQTSVQTAGARILMSTRWRSGDVRVLDGSLDGPQVVQKSFGQGHETVCRIERERARSAEVGTSDTPVVWL
eukprot:765694-Hanusia_phi.AAC.1